MVGVEDGGFSKAPLNRGPQKALLVCVLMQGNRIQSLCVDRITVDGLDATEKLLAMLRGLNAQFRQLA